MARREFTEELQSRVPDVVTREEQKRDVAQHQQCPICYGNYGGVGRCEGSYKKASTLTRRYYKCDRCNHTWTADFTPEAARPDAGQPPVEIKSQ